MRPHRRPGVVAALVASVVLLVSLDPARAAEDGRVPSGRSSDLRVATIPVEGMACLSCAASIKRAVKKIEGVSDAEVCGRCRYRSICPASASPGAPVWPRVDDEPDRDDA